MTTNIEIVEMPDKAKDGTTIVHVAVGGILNLDRYAFLEKAIRQLISKHGSIRVLVVLQRLDGMTADARREDQRFETRCLADVDRVAVVGSTWEDSGVPAESIPLADMNTRFFAVGEREQAVKWLKE
jgi:hypothetical protein